MFKEGQLIDGTYKILSNIVYGNNREVYLAYHTGLQKNVIIKKAADNIDMSADIDRDISSLKQLKHACIPEVYDFIRIGSRLYIVLEYVKGKSLEEFIIAGSFIKEKRIIKWLSQIAGALNYLHSRKKIIVHADIKPSNILVDNDDNIRIIGCDFVFGENDTELVADITLPYASPEQYRKATLFYNGQNHRKIILDGRSDMYSVAAVMYHIMTLTLPANPDMDSRPLSSWQLPYSQELIHVIDRAMSKNISSRYTDMLEMVNDIEIYKNKLENGDSKERKRKIGILAGIGVAVIVGAVVSCILINKMNIRARYNESMAAAKKAVSDKEYDTAWNQYDKAIRLNPGKGRPYIEVIDSLILADAGFDSYENARLKQIFTEERLDKLRSSDRSSYTKVMYDLGNAYYFMYSNEIIGRRLAKEYFELAGNVNSEENLLTDREQKRIRSLYKICEYSEALKDYDRSDNQEAVDFKEFWDNLIGILDIQYDLTADRLLAIKSYEVFYQYAWKYRSEFVRSGVTNAEMLNKMQEVRTQVMNISQLEASATMLPMSVDIESDIQNLEYNISQLEKTINSVEVSANIDMDTLHFGYELGSYIRSVLDYDAEHSIQKIVSDLEITIMDRYRVTQCQVVVFNGLDEQKLLVEGRDYEFGLIEDNAYIDDEGANGYKYGVRIHSNVFTEEGTYTVIVSAKDSIADKQYGENAPLISNTDVPASNIILKADNISFTIDRSAPELTVSGAADGKRYTSERELNIGYADICDISSISIEVTDGTNTIDEVKYSGSEFAGDDKKNGNICYTVREHQRYQNIKITAKDVSGNENVYVMRILITSSFINKVMNNRPVVIGVSIAMVTVILVLVLGIHRLRHR